MSEELIKRLRRQADIHVNCKSIGLITKQQSANAMLEAADRIEALTAENERLRGLLDAWLGLAREHLDTDVAGCTFAALAGKAEQ